MNRRQIASVLAVLLLALGVLTGRITAPSSEQVRWATRVVHDATPGSTLGRIFTKVVTETIYRPPKPYPRFEKIAGKADWPPISGHVVAFRGSCRLDSGAAASMAHVEASLGYHISFSSCWRSHAQQAAAYAQKPWLVAPPGHSLHEKGLAIDVSRVTDEIRRLLYLHGWQQFNAWKEPWHFSYRLVG